MNRKKADQSNIPSLVSLTGSYGLPDIKSAVASLELIQEPVSWVAPAARSVFGERDSNYFAVSRDFKTTNPCVSAPIYIASLKNVVVSPQGLVFTSEQKLIYESVFPWNRDSFAAQFEPDLTISGTSYAPRLSANAKRVSVPVAVYAREGGDAGYFFFVNSILPKLGLIQRHRIDAEIPILVRDIESFALQLISMLGLRNTLPSQQWNFVERLIYIGPFISEDNAYTWAPLGATLMKEFLQPLLPQPRSHRGTRRLYLSRADARVRRLTNESEVQNVLEARGFEVMTIGNMDLADQIELFSNVSHFVAPHGAGLANMAFMPEGSSVLEILSPARLWPSYRLLAARLGRNYHALVGQDVERGQTHMRGEGNEDFSCDPSMLGFSLNEFLI